ncbi:hypothetical protein [Pararobbsia silviterrae]|uniref:hypothetical protein n=1 Tax=Pararobbsia silviterrae TaxID=1792498 RepID=UPI0011C3B2E1|nr:hypothetical protein [Pararobbsia silviterrae]
MARGKRHRIGIASKRAHSNIRIKQNVCTRMNRHRDRHMERSTAAQRMRTGERKTSTIGDSGKGPLGWRLATPAIMSGAANGDSTSMDTGASAKRERIALALALELELEPARTRTRGH